MKIADFVSRDSLPAFERILSEFLRDGKVSEFEFEMVAARMAARSRSWPNSTAVRDAAGNFLMSRSTVFDITECKCVEHELCRSRTN